MVVYFRIIQSSSVIIKITKYIIKWDILDMVKFRSIIIADSYASHHGQNIFKIKYIFVNNINIICLEEG